MKGGLKQGGIGLIIALVIIAIVGIGGYATIKMVQKTKAESQKMMEEAKKIMEENEKKMKENEKMMEENKKKAEMLKAEVKTILDGVVAEMETDAKGAMASSTESLMSLKSKLSGAYTTAEGNMKEEIGKMQAEVEAMISKMKDTEDKVNASSSTATKVE